MKQLNKTMIFLGAALILTALVGGAYAFLFVSMKNKTKATTEILSEIADLSGRGANLVSIVSVLRNESANIDKLNSYFFNENDIVEFAKKIEALGLQSETVLTIESIEPGVSEKSTPYLNFRIKANGTFSNISRLLVLLENFPGEFNWKTVRLTRDTVTANNSALWTMEVYLSVLNFIK